MRRLRLLAELDRRGTIAAVAVSLHQTAPGVSTQLSALEREVGLVLTEKDGRRIRLTSAGKRLAAHARVLLDQLDVIDSEIKATKEGAVGTFRVAAFPSAARTVVARTWATLIADRSPLRLILEEAEPEPAIQALLLGTADVAITHSYSNIPRLLSDGLQAQTLLTENVWLAVNSTDPVAAEGAKSVQLTEFAGQNWLVPHPAWSCHEMVQRACAAAGFVPRTVAQATDFAVLAELVAAGAGVALIPELAINQLPKNVTLLPLKAPVRRHSFLVTRVATGGDPALGLLLQQLQTAAADVMAQRPVRVGSAPDEPPVGQEAKGAS